jgi:hypothetical protein
MQDYPVPIVAEKDQAMIKRMLESAIAQNSHNNLEFAIVTASGQHRWMAISWQPIYDDEQRHLGFRTSVRDITDRQGLKEQLRLYTEHLEQLVQERTAKIAQLQKHRRQMEKLAALGELAAGVAHEINNPLAGIRNAFALIKDSLPTDHEHFGLLGLVDNEIERISSTVHQLYQVYRRNPQPPTDLSIEKVIHDVVCLLEPTATRHRVQIRLLPEAGESCRTTVARLPQNELKQIFFNLIRNAIQASQPGQEVRVAIESDVDQLQIKVMDDGCGIADDVLPHIFEPFFTTKGQLKEGMGLGLAVTRDSIESMNGQIHIETKVGQGSTFTVTLPRRGAQS